MKKPQRLASEQGAIIVQAAMAMLVLMGCGVFAVDFGLLWVARTQAQSSADAGAIAGAIARAYDDATDPPSPVSPVSESVRQVVLANPVWFDASATKLDVGYACPPELSPGRCVRVDVYRDGTFGSTSLPVIFGPVLGITQKVRATATAQVAIGNGTTCLK